MAWCLPTRSRSPARSPPRSRTRKLMLSVFSRLKTPANLSFEFATLAIPVNWGGRVLGLAAKATLPLLRLAGPRGRRGGPTAALGEREAAAAWGERRKRCRRGCLVPLSVQPVHQDVCYPYQRTLFNPQHILYSQGNLCPFPQADPYPPASYNPSHHPHPSSCPSARTRDTPPR